MSGHPLAAGRAQDRESLLAKDRNSTTEPTPPTSNLYWEVQSTLPDWTPTKEDIYSQKFENIIKSVFKMHKYLTKQYTDCGTLWRK